MALGSRMVPVYLGLQLQLGYWVIPAEDVCQGEIAARPEDGARGGRRPAWRELSPGRSIVRMDVGCPPPPSGTAWQGAQSGQGTIELESLPETSAVADAVLRRRARREANRP